MSNLELFMMYVGGPVITIVASYFTFLQGRKKTNAEVKTNELDNTSKAISIWRDLAQNVAQDVTAQLESREELIMTMKSQMDMILKQNAELIEQNAKLLKQNKELISRVNHLEKDIQEFQKKSN